MIDFKLDPKSGVPFYRQVIDQVRYGIASGQLEAGEQLPTVRGLAVELKVNLNTISKAYKELEVKNVLESQQGTGTFIGSTNVELTLVLHKFSSLGASRVVFIASHGDFYGLSVVTLRDIQKN